MSHFRPNAVACVAPAEDLVPPVSAGSPDVGESETLAW
jgi:hypothetical protein